MGKKSDVNVMLKEAGILFAITLIAGLILGFVYELTKEPIRLQEENAIKQACAAVFSEAEEFVLTDYVPSSQVLEELNETGVKSGTVYETYDGSKELLGYVIEVTSTQGYGGNIVLYLGVTVDGQVNDISILEISETPGLGMRAEEVLVPQFHDKPVTLFRYTKSGSQADSEIDAISGATITTKAVVNAVNGGLRIYDELMQGGAGDE